MNQLANSASHDQMRAKLTQIFRYVQAFNHLQNPVQQEIQEQPWVMWLRNLPDHPSVRIGMHGGIDTGQARKNTEIEDDFILKVGKPRITEAPEPPGEIAPWLQNGWQDIDGSAKLDTTKIQSFNENPKRVQLFDQWVEKRNIWLETERPARDALRLYDKLNELRARLEREAERLELMLGDGILNWPMSNGLPVHHPILLLRLQLHFNPQLPQFTLKETEYPTELYTALFQLIPGINPGDIGHNRQDFEQNSWHPLDGDEVSQFLRRFIHQISPRGEFVANPNTLKNKNIPSITRDPVIFLRNRAQGFSTALEAILEDISHRRELPHALTGLVGIAPLVHASHDSTTNSSLIHSPYDEDEHVLLSKPANAEQIEIARRLERYGAVLVQGPPGTGKTHTIANLLGHFLAQGKSVLVTSQTSKALRVLREKVVEPLQPLCVSILDDESRKQMESAVDAITERLSSSSEYVLGWQADKLATQRSIILQRLHKAREELKEARNSEYASIAHAGQQYSPTEAARYIAAHQEAGWIPAPVTAGAPLPLSPEDVIKLYRTNATVTRKDEQEMVQGLPEANKFLSPAEFERLITEKSRLEHENVTYRRDLWRETRGTPSPDSIQNLQDQLTQALGFLQDQTPWRLAAIAAGREGGLRRQIWDDLITKIENVYQPALQAQIVLIEYDPVVPEDLLVGRIEKVIDEVIDHLEKSKKLSGITMWTHGDWKILIEQTRIKGRSPETREHFEALRTLVNLRAARADLLGRWQRQMTPQGAPDAVALGPAPENTCIHYASQLRQCLEWYATTWAPLEQQLKQQGLLWENLLAEMPVRIVAEYGELLRLKEVAQLHLPPILEAEIHYCQYKINEEKLSAPKWQLSLISSTAARTEVVQRLRAAIDNHDIQAYKEAMERLTDLQERQREHQDRDILLSKLERSAPNWAAAIRQREGIHGKSEVPGDPEAAWLWQQLHDELNRRSKLSLEDIQERIVQLNNDLQRITAELVEKKAWAAQIRRTTGAQRQALNGWKELMRKVGKGTGKRAAKLLAEARRLMPQCQTAVPVWIMPLSRVVQNFNPRQNRFDVVIIDEASQADIKALAALYMGQQIVIVGDDEQVTPLAVGQKIDNVEQLIAEHLQDIPLSAMYDGKLSIYQLAKTAPGFQPICLREHFRCVSPIIQFSNNLSYNGKIKPLRDDSEVKRRPPTVAYSVKSNDTTGSVNEEEAITTASLLIAATEQPEYRGATFGVISLVKDEQALRIDTLLNKYLSATEYADRKILCGNPAHFQGDERDVIFLSMVDTPKDGGPLALRSEDASDYMYKKRFNVAASRARDQLWVIHSLDPDTDLKDGDIRKKLILHARNSHDFVQQRAQQEKETDSEFERRVLQRLTRAGYRVTPQWPVGAYRIDLVVEGAGKRLAVECDGDRWHPIEKLEEDMARQAILERLGWRFVRIRGSQFFRDPDKAMAPVFARLEALEIPPEGWQNTTNQASQDGKELQQRIIRRAAELRQQWITASNQTYTQPLKPVSTPATNLPQNGNTSLPKSATPVSQVSARPEPGRGSTVRVTPPTGGTTVSIRSNQVSDQRKQDQPSPSDGITRAARQSNTKPVAPFNLVSYFKHKKLEFIDNRLEGGSIWVIGGIELRPIMEELKKKGLYAVFCPMGVAMTQNRSAWRI